MGILELAVISFVISIIAGALGYSGIARGAGQVAKALGVVFLLLALLLFSLLALGISALT